MALLVLCIYWRGKNSVWRSGSARSPFKRSGLHTIPIFKFLLSISGSDGCGVWYTLFWSWWETLRHDGFLVGEMCGSNAADQ